MAAQAVARLSSAAGPLGMVAGQTDDILPPLAQTSVEQIEQVHKRKTGALFEAAVCLGGLVAIGISGQLMIGLAGIPNPYEWEWSYNLMVILSLVVFALAPGAILGLDALIKPRLEAASNKGNRLARFLLYLT